MVQQAEYVAYGTYEPLSVTITHILNNKSGVSFTSYSHTGLPVAMFADGVTINYEAIPKRIHPLSGPDMGLPYPDRCTAGSSNGL